MSPVCLKRDADLELLAAVLAGHRRAFERFLKRFAPVIRTAICKVLLRHLGTFSETDVEDHVQDAYMDLVANDYAKLRVYDGRRCSLVTWLSLLARNRTLSTLRGREPDAVSLEERDALRRPESTYAHSESEGERLRKQAGTLPPEQPDEAYENTERRERVLAAYNALSPEQRAMVDEPLTEQVARAERAGQSVPRLYSRRLRVFERLLAS